MPKMDEMSLMKWYTFVMRILEKNSFCKIQKQFDLSRSDEEVISFLYLPILKSPSTSLYISLFYYADLCEKLGGFLSDDLLSTLGMSESDFLLCRSQLEAIGLLEVYRKEERDSANQVKAAYLYRLLPPASPKKFFNDVLLKSLLNEAVGNKRYFFLLSYFKADTDKLPEGYINVTTPFKDVFSPKVKEDDLSLSIVDQEMEDKTYKSQSDFDTKLLREKLKAIGYPLKDIKSQIKEIENICVLYSPDIDDVVSLICDNTDMDGIFYLDSFNRDIRNLRQFASPEREKDNNQAYGNSEISKIVEKFNLLTPDEYLSIMFNARPASFMLDEIEKIKKDLNFPNPVINVILDYCLRKTHGEFNTVFIDKVSYTLSAMDAKNAYDAMTKLNSRDFELSQVRRKKKTQDTLKPEKEEKKEEKQVSQDDLLDLDKEFSL